MLDMDIITNITSPGRLHSTYIYSIKLVSGKVFIMIYYLQIPDISKPSLTNHPIKHNVFPHSETTCPQVYVKARRLTPDRLEIAKDESQQMFDLGHLRASKSTYALPLHLLPKKDSPDW